AAASGSEAPLPSVGVTTSTNLPRAASGQSIVAAPPIGLPVHDRGQSIRLNPVAVLVGVGVTGSAPTAMRPRTAQPQPLLPDATDEGFGADLLVVDPFFRSHFQTVCRLHA